MRRVGVLPAVLVAVVVLGGCAVRTRHANGTLICGTRLPTGAVSIGATPVEDPGPSPAAGPAPAADELPALLDPIDARYNGAAFVRVSDSCEHGAVVVVRPVVNGELLTAVRAKDHHVVVLVMDLSEPVTVQAWRAGKFAGSLRLNATSRRAG